MRSVNLIPKKSVDLKNWADYLAGNFPIVWIDHSDILASTEGHSPGALNKLTIEDGAQHIFVLDRPTTIREYEPEEVKALQQIVGEPKQFFAVDYTDEGLLRRVLDKLLQREGKGNVVVEDEHGNLALLEDFLV